MKGILQLALGVMAALGGFVDAGELVFAADGGARFGYSLIWPVLAGTIGIILYSEMCGRIAVVAPRPVFDVVRDRRGRRVGMVALVSGNLVNTITCAAEIGVAGIILHLLTGLPYRWLIVLSTATPHRVNRDAAVRMD